MSYKGKWEAQDRSSPEMKGIQYMGVELNKEVYPYIINMPSPPFALGRCGAIVTRDPMNPDGAKANAQLIASAVNACQKVNPDNPQAVAESISDFYEALKKIVTEAKENAYYHQVMLDNLGIMQKALAKAEAK